MQELQHLEVLRMNLQLLLLSQVLVKHNVIGSVNTAYPFASLTPLFQKQQYFFHKADYQYFKKPYRLFGTAG